MAAIATRNNANLLAEYADDGAGRAIKIMKVEKIAGQVVDVGLVASGVAGAVRGTVSIVGEGAARDVALDAPAEPMLINHYGADAEIISNLNNVKWAQWPKGSVAGGVKPGTSSGAGRGFIGGEI